MNNAMLNASSISLYTVMIVQDIVRTWPLDPNPNTLAQLPLSHWLLWFNFQIFTSSQHQWWPNAHMCIMIYVHVDVSCVGVGVKIDVPNSVTYFNWTPIFEWYVVGRGSKNKYQNMITILDSVVA